MKIYVSVALVLLIFVSACRSSKNVKQTESIGLTHLSAMSMHLNDTIFIHPVLLQAAVRADSPTTCRPWATIDVGHTSELVPVIVRHACSQGESQDTTNYTRQAEKAQRWEPVERPSKSYWSNIILYVVAMLGMCLLFIHLIKKH